MKKSWNIIHILTAEFRTRGIFSISSRLRNMLYCCCRCQIFVTVFWFLIGFISRAYEFEDVLFYCFSVVHLNLWVLCFYCFAHCPFKFTSFFLPCLFELFANHLGVYNKHFITRVPRLYGLYSLVKAFLSLSRSAPSFEKLLTREYNPYALGNRVIIDNYLIIGTFSVQWMLINSFGHAITHVISLWILRDRNS